MQIEFACASSWTYVFKTCKLHAMSCMLVDRSFTLCTAMLVFCMQHVIFSRQSGTCSRYWIGGSTFLVKSSRWIFEMMQDSQACITSKVLKLTWLHMSQELTSRSHHSNKAHAVCAWCVKIVHSRVEKYSKYFTLLRPGGTGITHGTKAESSCCYDSQGLNFDCEEGEGC